MHGTRFTADELPLSWLKPVDCTELAKLCQGAGLSCIQAEVVRRVSTRYTLAEIAEELQISEGRARYVAVRAEWRIRRTQPWVTFEIREELRAVIECLRNTFNAKPSLSIYRKVPGGYDEVRLRATAPGTRPEDFMDEEGRLLTSLPRLLSSRSMEQPQQ